MVYGTGRRTGADCFLYLRKNDFGAKRILSPYTSRRNPVTAGGAVADQRGIRDKIYCDYRRMGCSDSRRGGGSQNTGRIYQFSAGDVQRDGADKIYSTGISDGYFACKKRKDTVGAEQFQRLFDAACRADCTICRFYRNRSSKTM